VQHAALADLLLRRLRYRQLRSYESPVHHLSRYGSIEIGHEANQMRLPDSACLCASSSAANRSSAATLL
jgi:hypothetical protein